MGELICEQCGKNESKCLCDILEFNHKGQWCKIKNILCQEGWCKNCIIYRKRNILEVLTEDNRK